MNEENPCLRHADGSQTTGACPAITTAALRSAAAVQRLMSAGAIPIGKTNMDQFATGLVGTRSPFGACHSVASAAHISGGSQGLGLLLPTVSAPLSLGLIELDDGRWVTGFVGDSMRTESAEDITSYGGWRAYLERLIGGAPGPSQCHSRDLL